ncbi:WYL domain-containing protein [Luteolibacter soli]|uniref:WYL domain-containing protein n=1 Tax=Luteolibacter soli TaxID=3135280 RepID=A0ABU9AXI9_9BACT
MPIPIALSDIRAAIRQSRRVVFTYEKKEVMADFYLLGQARKTGAYVILAWCLEPVKEWRLLRYSLVKDLEAVGQMDEIRPDFDSCYPGIATVDTQAFHVARRHS